jgi:predicted dehydrogenase
MGFMGVTHLSGYARIPGVSVAAISSGNPAVLAGDLSKIGGNIKREGGPLNISEARKYTDWRELAADPQLDAVDICLPTDMHAAVTVAALKAGKHVLCEKPMALSAAECTEMQEEAARQKRVLMIGQVLRFWPEYVYLQRFGKGKEYGTIRSVTFVRQCGLPDWSKWLPVEAQSGGAVIDLLIHDIDQALLLCGMPQKVSAKQLGEHDALMATLIYPGGPEVRIQGGWFQAGAPLKMTFQARAERAELEFGADGLVLRDSVGQRTNIKAEGGDGYDAEVAYFVECCRAGKAPERCLPQESAQAVRLALLLKQSRAKNGEQIAC